ncbi:MAG: rod shape-determining protein MreD [Melioribacter sp.]|jgi:rod shape-determining protein MreD|uniref:rod shape-determining protein MreD n=1 Tax=Melioribacter sp. TaxID=2052167 RepID=UPI003BEBE70D
MIKQFSMPVLLFILVAAVQLTVVPLISISGIAPNLLIVLITFYALSYGQIFGMSLGFIFGFLYDLISGGAVGINMFAMTISGFMAGYFYNENKIEINTATMNFFYINLVAAVAYSFLYTLIAAARPDLNLFILLIEGSLLPALYTSVFALPVVIAMPRRELR